MRSDRYKDEPVVEKKKKKHGPLKALLILILVLAAAVAGATAYFYKTSYDSLSVTFTEEAPVLEFGESYPSMKFVKESEPVKSLLKEVQKISNLQFKSINLQCFHQQ